LVAGWLVDRVGAARLFPWMLTTMIGALACLLLAGHHWLGLGFFAFVGLGFGGVTVISALLADLYGAARIGEIRATSGAFAVFGTALAPALAGWALLRGWSFDDIFTALLGLAILSFLAACPVPWWAGQRRREAEMDDSRKLT
jgi:MFS family permease